MADEASESGRREELEGRHDELDPKKRVSSETVDVEAAARNRTGTLEHTVSPDGAWQSFDSWCHEA
jgi:hypothetical protein